jgi:hypothetical protein
MSQVIFKLKNLFKRRERFHKIYDIDVNKVVPQASKADLIKAAKEAFLVEKREQRRAKSMKHSSVHPGDISAELAQRLLETKKILTLPIHSNISLLTNSYDVVHS